MLLIFIVFLATCSLSVAEFSAQKSPFSQDARFNVDRKDGNPIAFVMDGFANIVSDSFRYYFANPYRNFRNQPEYPAASTRYQIFTENYLRYHHFSQKKTAPLSERAAVTSPTCPTGNDPKPSGGASCTKDLDCNSLNQGGVCNFNSTNTEGNVGSCLCANGWGNPDCSYRRKSKDLAGGLQIGLVFCGIGGVGNFILGRTGMGVGQLILMLGYYLCCVSICLLVCELMVPGIVLIILAACAYLAGFIWAIVDGANMLQCNIPDAAGYALF